MSDRARIEKMIRRGADAVVERFGEATRFGVEAWIRCGAPGEGRRFCLMLVQGAARPRRRRAEPEAAGLWHVEGPSANGAVVRFRRRLATVDATGRVPR